MSNVLDIKNLTKEYEKFKLDSVSFSVKEGTIMGFIGRNGAGKSTTLKCIMDLVRKDSGDIFFFGKSFKENETYIKENTGYALGEVDFFFRKKIKDIIDVTKRFYPNWDDNACNKYLNLFKLDKEKKLMELSAGMKVKFNLVLALSHKAKLIILDEPTSGLDPVSREELLDVFLDLVNDGVSILFSTHITSDLDKCAEYITYIKQGKIIASGKTNDFIDKYRLIKIPLDKKEEINKEEFLGTIRTKDYITALINKDNQENFSNFEIIKPNLEEVMIHLEKEM